MKQFPCKELDDLDSPIRFVKQSIVNNFSKKDDETIIKEFKRRDYLLSIGMKIDEIYTRDGEFNEINIASKLATIEQEKLRIHFERLRT